MYSTNNQTLYLKLCEISQLFSGVSVTMNVMLTNTREAHRGPTVFLSIEILQLMVDKYSKKI